MTRRATTLLAFALALLPAALTPAQASDPTTPQDASDNDRTKPVKLDASHAVAMPQLSTFQADLDATRPPAELSANIHPEVAALRPMLSQGEVRPGGSLLKQSASSKGAFTAQSAAPSGGALTPGGGAAPNAGQVPNGAGASTGSQPRSPGHWGDGAVPCQSAPEERCYSPEQLQWIADHIGHRYPELDQSAHDIFTHPADPNNVREDDVENGKRHLFHEGQSIMALTYGTRIPWPTIKAKPGLVGERWSKIDPQSQENIRKTLTFVTRTGERLLADKDNVFSEGFKTNDILGPDVIKEMNVPGDHGSSNGNGPSGGSSQGGSAPDPGGHTSAADDALHANSPQFAAYEAGQALQLNPSNEKALSILAAAQYDMKDMSAAASAANKALELDPSDAQAQTVARLAHDLAARNAKIAAAPKQDHAYADVPAGLSGANAPWHQLSVSDEKQRQANEAARSAERALNMKDYAGAMKAADKALELAPHSAYAYGLKAYAEMQAGDHAAALRDAVAGLALNPADKLAQLARAKALLNLGQYKDGLYAARAAVAGDPNGSVAHFLLAEALAANGDNAGARAELKRAAQLDKRYAQFYEESLQVSDNADMAFLFPDLKAGAAAAAAPARPSRAGRFLKVAGGAAAGGGLLAWLFWQLFGASLAPALKTVFTRKGPRVSEPGDLAPEAAPRPAAAPLLGSSEPGLLRGQYKTVRQIGMGGMGMVYEGTDVSLNRRVAIKKMRDELRLDRRQRERFVQEAKLVAALHHPSVVDIYAIVDDKDELALIFEYVSGKTLHEIVHGRGPLPFAEALRVYRGVASALECAHARGIIHRDLKPSNIMLTDEGAPKVMDFGIARTAKDALTRYSMTNTIVGTPPYMAPEQEQGVVRKESDVFALAVCLYETLTGALPFAGSGGGMVMNKLNKAYVPASKVAGGLPPGLDEVLDRAFEPDPDKRYRSVAELLAALEALPVSAAA